MNRDEIQKKYLELLDERHKKERRIIEEAQRNGTWKPGLDSNNELFVELNADFKKSIEKLKSMLTEASE